MTILAATFVVIGFAFLAHFIGLIFCFVLFACLFFSYQKFSKKEDKIDIKCPKGHKCKEFKDKHPEYKQGYGFCGCKFD